MMEHLNMQSMDKVAANVAKIMELFPNCVTERINAEGKLEHAIDFDMLRQELNDYVVDGLQERYQFTWPDKRSAILAANAPINKTLRPCREESVDFDNTENLYIEGDNLEVLKLLQETYLGKVKMIYIDPPYNTGNDFVYEDDFKQSAGEYIGNSGQLDEEGNRLVANTESNGRFHTDWLNMMYPRLKLAKDLLDKDEGVIFISIDDSEVENLKKICDEIFGKRNFITQLVWEKKKKGSFLSISITNIKEYILVYSKNINRFSGLIGEVNSEVETYPCINAVNKREVRYIPKGIESKYKEKNYFLPMGTEISDTTMSIKLLSDLRIINGILSEDLQVEGNWRYSQDAMKQYALNKELYITRDLYIRRIVKDARYKTLKDLLLRLGDERNNDYIDLYNLNGTGWGSNEDADEELRLLFGKQKLIDYPKPLRLLFKLIASHMENKNSLILDFFSGSATTAHAVMQLNAEDGGKRKFIMVQLPEVCAENSEAYKAGYKNICEIGKERIRRAGQKIKEENPLTTQDLDIGFRVLKCDSSNMEDVYFTPKEYMNKQQSLFIDNIKKDRSDEDLLFDAMLKLDTPLSSKIEKITVAGKTVYNVAQGHLMACFDKNVTDEVITAIAKEMPSYFVMRDSSQADDSVAINFEQIFNTYSPQTVRRVL